MKRSKYRTPSSTRTATDVEITPVRQATLPRCQRCTTGRFPDVRDRNIKNHAGLQGPAEMPTVGSLLAYTSLPATCCIVAVVELSTAWTVPWVEAVLYVLHEFARSSACRCGGEAASRVRDEGRESSSRPLSECLRGFYVVTAMMSVLRD